MPESVNSSKFGSFLRHPLTAILIGFLLTGLIGAWLSYYYNLKQMDRERALDNIVARRQAAQDFARFIYERRTRAELLSSAFRRQAQMEEIISRKKQYDESYASWGSNLQANLLIIRSLVESLNYSEFEYDVEFYLVPIFRRIDQCLTAAYDLCVANKNYLSALDKCDMVNELQLALDCGYAITDELFKFAMITDSISEKLREERWAISEKEIIIRCTRTMSPNE